MTFYIYADGKPLYYPMDDGLTVITPKLTLEMGKAGSLAFGLPPTNKRYGDLRKLRTIITVEYGDKEIFRGRVLSEEKDFNNIKTIYCEGDLAYLVDSVQSGKAYTGTAHALFAKILEEHNKRVEPHKQFKLGNVMIEDRPVIITGNSDAIESAETTKFNNKQIALNAITSDWETTFDYITSSLIDYCGGYLRTRRVGNDTYLDYVLEYGGETSQEIEFGINMLDLQDETDTEELFTVLIPLGDDNLTVKSVNGGSDELVDEAAVEEYGRIIRTHVFDGVTSAKTLLENGKRYLADNTNIPRSLTITAVDLNMLNPDIEEICIGDKVSISSKPHGISDKIATYKIEYDIQSPENTLYTFGVPRQTLTQRYKRDKQKAAESTKSAAASGGQAAADKTDEEINKAYEEWIAWDPDDPNGHLTLKMIYNQYENDKLVLKNSVGIDLSTPDGLVNIRNLREEVDENGKAIDRNQALIQTSVNDLESQISLEVSKWNDEIHGEKGVYAEIKLTAEDLGSKITATADSIELVSGDVTKISKTVDGHTTEIASFDTEIARIDAIVTSVNTLIATNVEAKTITLSGGVTISGNFGLTSNGRILALGGVSLPDGQKVLINGKNVPHEDRVEEIIKDMRPAVSWGEATLTGTNKRTKLKIGNVERTLSLSNHTHNYLSSLPTHRHTITVGETHTGYYP